MTLTIDQVAALAPDASAASAGRKLGGPAPWRNLGRSERSLWGECQGSAVYQVRVALSDLASQCSCPSRKLPCKHALGLLFLSASAPQALPAAPEPEWVSGWLSKRAEEAAQREARAGAKKESRAPDLQAQEARAQRRLERVRQGIEGLDLWLGDLLRNGLALVEAQPPSFWEGQAARLVDAQAPGLASRLRRMAGLLGAHPEWPALLLAELGRLALLTQAFRRLDTLDPALREDVRRLVGFTLSQEEVAAGADAVTDRWVVLGQIEDEDERLRSQRTWLLGEATGRCALLLQFAVGDAGFPALFAPGSRFEADLAFWPSAWPQRALVKDRRGATQTVGSLPAAAGTGSIGAFLEETAEALARQPWLDRFPCVLRGAVPVSAGGGFQIRDAEGLALPLVRGDHWKLVALSGGRPLDLMGEWDGGALLPLGAGADGGWHHLGRDL